MDISKHIDNWRVLVENGMTGLESDDGMNSLSSENEQDGKRSELEILTDRIYKKIKERADTSKFTNDIRTLINLVLSMYRNTKDPVGGDAVYIFDFYTDALFFDSDVGKMMKKAAELKTKEKISENTGTGNENDGTGNMDESFSDEDRITMKKLGIGNWLSDDEFAEWLKNDYAKRSVQNQLRIYGIILKKLNGDQEKALKMFEYFEQIISRFNSSWKRNDDFGDDEFHSAYEHLDNWVKQMGGHSKEIDELIQIVKTKFKADEEGLSHYYQTHDRTGD